MVGTILGEIRDGITKGFDGHIKENGASLPKTLDSLLNGSAMT